MRASPRVRIPGPSYAIELVFAAPLAFSYRWCTDFSPQDAELEGEQYTRKVISRKARRVVYEDLRETKDGYLWAHMDVTLRPPNRWHVESVGSHRIIRGDYQLSSLGPERTLFHQRWRRKSTPLTKVKMTKAERENSTRGMWKKFGRALERDYQRSQRSTRPD